MSQQTIDRQGNRVSTTFARLRALYGHKAKDLVPTDGQAPTPEYRLWCKKTAHLTDAQFEQAITLLERQEYEARRAGDETWPPSYAGFIGLATMTNKPRDTRSPIPVRTDKEIARQKMDEIRAMLDMPPFEPKSAGEMY